MNDQYDALTKVQLLNLLRKRDAEKKLGLVWERDEIEADRAVDADFVACRLDETLSDQPAPWANLIIEADNYDALRWLRMAYAQRIKCIYIDPPYNTGNRDWVYNDHYVDKSDRWRHSTWLEFLYRRLVLARDLLTPDGVMFISINDENRARLELLADEALPGMRVGSLVWRTKDSSNDAEKNFSSVHEHILIYGMPQFSFLGFLLDKKKYKNPDGDIRGDYSLDPITKGHDYTQRDGTYYPVQDPETGWWYPCNPESVWRYASETKMKPGQRLRTETIESLIRDKRIVFSADRSVTYESKEDLIKAIRLGTGPVDGKGRPLLREDLPDIDFWVGKPIGLGRPSKKAFWDEKKTKYKPVSSYIFGGSEIAPDDYHTLRSDKQGPASDEIQQIFGSKVFPYPKPVRLVKALLESTMDSQDMVLDFFAGSGTTAQAVMELNAEDEGDRRFIMVSSTEATEEEGGKNICRDVTAKRVQLLNASSAGAYAPLKAGYAYLRAREIDFQDLDYEISAEEVWIILQSIHSLPLKPYETGAPWQEYQTEDTIVVFVDNFAPDLIARLQSNRLEAVNAFVYSWAPGQLAAAIGTTDAQLVSVRETLMRRFQQ